MKALYCYEDLSRGVRTSATARQSKKSSDSGPRGPGFRSWPHHHQDSRRNTCRLASSVPALCAEGPVLWPCLCSEALAGHCAWPVGTEGRVWSRPPQCSQQREGTHSQIVQTVEEGKETAMRIKGRGSPEGLGKPREVTGEVTFECSFGRSRIFGDGR